MRRDPRRRSRTGRSPGSGWRRTGPVGRTSSGCARRTGTTRSSGWAAELRAMMPWSEEGKAGKAAPRGGSRDRRRGGQRRPLTAASHAVREGLGRPRRHTRTTRAAGAALRGPAPGARGHLAPGVRGPAAGRPAGSPARPHGGDGGPQRVHRRSSAADRRPGLRAARSRRWCGTRGSSGIELFDLDSPGAGHRARDRSRAGRSRSPAW